MYKNHAPPLNPDGLRRKRLMDAGSRRETLSVLATRPPMASRAVSQFGRSANLAGGQGADLTRSNRGSVSRGLGPALEQRDFG